MIHKLFSLLFFFTRKLLFLYFLWFHSYLRIETVFSLLLIECLKDSFCIFVLFEHIFGNRWCRHGRSYRTTVVHLWVWRLVILVNFFLFCKSILNLQMMSLPVLFHLRRTSGAHFHCWVHLSLCSILQILFGRLHFLMFWLVFLGENFLFIISIHHFSVLLVTIIDLIILYDLFLSKRLYLYVFMSFDRDFWRWIYLSLNINTLKLCFIGKLSLSKPWFVFIRTIALYLVISVFTAWFLIAP